MAVASGLTGCAASRTVTTASSASASGQASAAPAGTNAAYGYCELSTVVTPAAYKGHKTMFCTALVAKGQVVMRLRVYGDQPTEASGHQKLDAAVALAVPPFVAAAPAT